MRSRDNNHGIVGADQSDPRVEKINKLLAKAQSTNSEEEAQSLFAKAEELMTKWAIDDAMLEAAGKKPEDVIEERRVDVPSTYFDPDVQLAYRIGLVHNVRLLQNKRGKYFVLIGFKSDVDRVLQLYVELRLQAIRFARQADMPGGEYMSGMDKYVFRRSFREGFADRVGVRLQEQRERTTAEEAKSRGTGMELVLVDRKTRVDQYYDSLAKGRARARQQRYSAAGAAAGRAAANRADLGNRRVSGRRALSQ